MAVDVNFWNTAVPIVASNSTVYSPALRGLLVMATGTVNITTAKGQDLTVTVASAPFVVPFYISKVRTGGSVADASMFGGLD